MKLKFQISPKSYEKICVRICEKLKKCYVQDNINKSNKLGEGGRYRTISTNVTETGQAEPSMEGSAFPGSNFDSTPSDEKTQALL